MNALAVNELAELAYQMLVVAGIVTLAILLTVASILKAPLDSEYKDLDNKVPQEK